LVAVAVLGGCDDSTAPQDRGQVQILLTDAPSDYIGAAEVSISRVYLVGGQDESEENAESEEEPAGFVDLFNDPENPLSFNLLDLQNGITEALTDVVEVEAGSYGQLRLVVDEALVTLAEGYQFEDGGVEMPLMVPSGMQSGIKVHLAAPVEVSEGALTVLTVDFDVEDNFVIQGNPDTPAGIKGILFTPVLKEKGRTEEAPES